MTRNGTVFPGDQDARPDIAAMGGDPYKYDAFGQLTWMNATPVGVDNPWRYVSAYQDGTGLYKMGARYYDPTLGRFTQQDPVFNPLDPRSWNRYAYVGNDPVNYTDPSGMMSCGWCSDAWDATQGVRNYAWCITKNMLPVNPDDLIELWNLPGGPRGFGGGLNPVVYRIYTDAATYGGEQVAKRLAEHWVINGVKMVPYVKGALLLVDGAMALKSCA